MHTKKTEGKDSHAEMAQAPLNEGISLIFDQDAQSSSPSSPPRSRYPSRSSHNSSHSSGSRRQVKRNDACRGRHRSRSSHSSNGSPRTRPRSRSHPRCHRASSSSRCCRQHRQAHRHRRHCSPPRCYRAHSRSYSPSSSPDRSHRLSHRSRSRSASRRRVSVGRYKCRFSGSPYRSHKTYTSRSRSRSSGRSVVSLSIEEKGELLRTAKANATQALGVEQLDLSESVKPVLEEQQVKTRPATPEPEERVRPEPLPQKSLSQQSSDIEPEEDAPTPNMSPKKKMISFSIHNSVAKPTAIVASTTSKVTPRVENYTTSRNPFGHWVPVRKTVQSSFSRTSCKH